jgi:DNA-binding NarL/FixJ family response regulator
MAARISVLCVDDHIVVRVGLSTIIDHQPDMKVVAHASDGDDAVQQFRTHRPSVVLMDLRLPGKDGFQATRAIRQIDPAARIIVLTMFEGAEDMRRAVEAGASGYLLKDTLADNLVHAIRTVHQGGKAFPLRGPQIGNKGQALTRREEEVIRLLGRGLKNRDIAVSLGISEDTIQAHMRSIFLKLEVHDRTTALAVALRRGIIHLD